MSYYELFNQSCGVDDELQHGSISSYELYHHGIKGQKWGVRRQQKKTASRKARRKVAGERIKRSSGSKGLAAAKRVGIGYLRQLGKNFVTSNAARVTMTIAMNSLNPPVAAAAFVATTAIALADVGLTVNNIYKTGRDVYDIAKHDDASDYLEHHGILGQKWGVRRFQDKTGALTRLGEQRANLDSDWHPSKKISSGDFMTDLHNDISAVNHNGGNHELGRGTNCLYCTTAYEMRRRGYDVQAQQDWVGGIRSDMPAAMFIGAKNENIYNISNMSPYDPDRSKYTREGTQKMIQTVEAQGEGARGYVSVQWQGGQGGHSMAYEVVNGKMHLIDCQTGEDLTGRDIWRERMAYADSCTITRVDNCEFDKQMVDRYVEDYGTDDSYGIMDEMLNQLFDKLKKKKKKKGSGSIKKKVNKYEAKVKSVWKSTKRSPSNSVKAFINKRM